MRLRCMLLGSSPCADCVHNISSNVIGASLHRTEPAVSVSSLCMCSLHGRKSEELAVSRHMFSLVLHGSQYALVMRPGLVMGKSRRLMWRLELTLSGQTLRIRGERREIVSASSPWLVATSIRLSHTNFHIHCPTKDSFLGCAASMHTFDSSCS